MTHRGGRTTPLGYDDQDDQLVVFASNLGAPNHPDWYRNVMANPGVVVEVGTERFLATAEVLTGAKRTRAWDLAIAAKPFLVEHQAKAGNRHIPLVALRRRSELVQ